MTQPNAPKPVVTLGESMGLVRANEIGSLAHVSNLTLGFGGAESNVAIGLARLGTPVTWLGRVGDDSLGRRITQTLRGEGVDVRAVINPDATTGLMLKESTTGQSTSVFYYRAGSAGSTLTPADLDGVDIAGAALLHVTGITLALSTSARDTVLEAVERAVAAGVPVSFDVNHRSRLWKDTREAVAAYREITARATVVFAGDDEAGLIESGDHTPESVAHAIADLGPSEVVIKRGAAGCLALVNASLFARDAIPIRPVDTVGAGDAFVAGYLAELVAGSSPERRLDVATRAGAYACLNPGDWEGLPRRSELATLDSANPVTR
ncbi:MAG: sugar kinase [Glaciihabitans sp.]|nr:sugar kinase [Glaciihabitans sp.]